MSITMAPDMAENFEAHDKDAAEQTLLYHDTEGEHRNAQRVTRGSTCKKYSSRSGAATGWPSLAGGDSTRDNCKFASGADNAVVSSCTEAHLSFRKIFPALQSECIKLGFGVDLILRRQLRSDRSGTSTSCVQARLAALQLRRARGAGIAATTEEQ